MRKMIWFVLLMVGYSILHTQPISQKEQDILQLQDQRSLGDGKLLSYLSDENAIVRYRAAIALANLQDTSVVEALATAIKDRDIKVRAASALALGQIGGRQVEEILLANILTERSIDVLARVFEAIGKIGSPKSLDSILNQNAEQTTLCPKKDIALCIARFAIRQIKTERSIWKCFEYLDDKSAEVRSAALFALWRSAPNGLIDLEIEKKEEDLLKLADDKNINIRMHLATLLGRSKAKSVEIILDELEKTETKLNDWHVWVQIIRAHSIQSISRKVFPSQFSDYLAMKNEHIKITTLQSFTGLPAVLVEQYDAREYLKDQIINIAKDSINEIEAVRGETLVALGKHFPGELSQFHTWFDQQISPRLKAKLLEGVSQQSNQQNLNILINNLDNESIRVSMAALDFIKRMLVPSAIKSLELDSVYSAKLASVIFQKVKISLAKNDIGINTIISNLFADTTVFKIFDNAGLSREVVDELIAAYKRINTPDASEAKQSILQALGRIRNVEAVPFLENALLEHERSIAVEAVIALQLITGKDYSDKLIDQVAPTRTIEDWKMFSSIKQQQRVRIKTKYGDIVIELMKNDAPFTVLNFVKLVKNKLYDGLSFHRVVPNFVIQGGDPRGDGWGGPGYTIRSEISLVNYESGSCGMASAGKDTEGCQFFITHVSAPQLDGRYTIFAKVIKGMEVVERIQIGDYIQSVRLEQ